MARKSPRTQQDAFLQAIVEDPRDDATRLVYADWLEEDGQPERAQFIRVQVALAGCDPDDPRRAALEREERKLLKGRKAAWKAELPKLKGVAWGEFTRGFVGSVTFVSTYRFHQYAPQVTRAAPIESVAFRPATRGFARSVAGLARSKYLGKVRHLTLAHQQLNDEAAHILACSGVLTSLEVLDLSHNQIGEPGAHVLAESAPLAALKRLDLTANPLGAKGRAHLRACFGERVVLDPAPAGR